MKRTDLGNAEAPFAYEGLERVMHEKARLGLLSSLVAHPKGLTFSDLRQLCGLSDGNLSRHLQILQEAKLVEIRKAFEGSRPQTTCYLTLGAAGNVFLSTLHCWSSWCERPRKWRAMTTAMRA